MASLGMLQNVPQVWIWKTGDVKVSSVELSPLAVVEL